MSYANSTHSKKGTSGSVRQLRAKKKKAREQRSRRKVLNSQFSQMSHTIQEKNPGFVEMIGSMLGGRFAGGNKEK